MIGRLCALCTPTLILILSAVPHPQSSPIAPIAPIEYSDGQVVSGSVGLSRGGQLTLDGNPIELIGLQLADASEACSRQDGSLIDCQSMIRQFLENQSAGKDVQCWMEMDGAAKLSGRCSINDSDLNAMLVHAGLARANIATGSDYGPLEHQAHNQRIGLWTQNLTRD